MPDFISGLQSYEYIYERNRKISENIDTLLGFFSVVDGDLLKKISDKRKFYDL